MTRAQDLQEVKGKAGHRGLENRSQVDRAGLTWTQRHRNCQRVQDHSCGLCSVTCPAPSASPGDLLEMPIIRPSPLPFALDKLSQEHWAWPPSLAGGSDMHSGLTMNESAPGDTCNV